MRHLLWLSGLVWAQISITSSDLPSPGSSYTIGQVRPNPTIDFAATGAGYTWDFSGLRADTHFVAEWKSIASAPQYSFSCGNWQVWQSILLKVADSIPSPAFTLRDVYGFLSKTDSHLRIEGLGATLNGAPLTYCYQDPDEIYVLPLNYNDRDSTTFRLRIQFQLPNQSGTVVIVQQGYRIHEADGYGQVRIPLGQFSCLRLKRKVYQRDTIYWNNFPVQRRDTTYYELEWLAQGRGIPLVQVTGDHVRGNFVATSVTFQDNRSGSIRAYAVQEGGLVSPNPTQEVLLLPAEGESYAVYDLMGRLRQEGSWPTEGRLVLSEDLPEGIYFLRLRFAGGETHHRFVRIR